MTGELTALQRREISEIVLAIVAPLIAEQLVH
jgi:hypothetical protein